jgi:hypothetical protein
MGYIKWSIRTLLLILFIGFLHYTLPQQDIVRITDTYEKRIDFGTNSLFWAQGDSGNATTTTNRDVFFIQAFRANDKPIIYRNEDTGFLWPPYFKFDTANLQAEASDAISKKDAEVAQWVVVRHYGWRNEFLSIYPNALDIRAASGPDEQIIPWGNVIRILLILAVFWAIWVRWRRFAERVIDPRVERVSDWFGDKFTR